MIALYDNLVKTATITADTENASYGFSVGLKDTRLSRFGRSTDNDGWIKFDLATAKQVDYICIKGHNFTATATVTLEGHTADTWASPTFSKTLTVADTIYTTVDDELRWWRITVVDAALSYLQCAYVFLGEGLSMPGMDRAQIFSYLTQSKTAKSPGMQLYGDIGEKYKAIEINLPNVTQTQKTGINTMFTTIDIVYPFIVIFWDNNVDVEEPFYCNLIEPPVFKRLGVDGVMWSLGMKLEECK